MKLTIYFYKIVKKIYSIFTRPGILTYAQYGEDIILQGLCHTIGINTPRYIDIGTHHATTLSNTYFFYKKGSCGVCVEPSPDLARAIKQTRPRDIVRAVGVGAHTSNTPLPYYVLTAQTMNTFSKHDAEQTTNAPQMYGPQKIERVEEVPVIGINDILSKYSSYTDIVSIDTEGMDEEIVRAIDFTQYRPKIFCIETITQSDTGMFEKNNSLITYLQQQNYVVYADTYVNTIFVDKTLWKEGATII